MHYTNICDRHKIKSQIGAAKSDYWNTIMTIFLLYEIVAIFQVLICDAYIPR
jgi:hypothetical protein